MLACSTSSGRVECSCDCRRSAHLAHCRVAIRHCAGAAPVRHGGLSARHATGMCRRRAPTTTHEASTCTTRFRAALLSPMRCRSAGASRKKGKEASAAVPHPFLGRHAARDFLQFSGCAILSSSGHISASVYFEARSYEDLPSCDLSSERAAVERVRLPHRAGAATQSRRRVDHPCRRAGRLRIRDRCEWSAD